MNAIFEAGYGYEVAGLVYYIFFIVMTRRRDARFSQRSRVLALVAAIALVGSVPFHYATNAAGVALMLILGAASLISSFIDLRPR